MVLLFDPFFIFFFMLFTIFDPHIFTVLAHCFRVWPTIMTLILFLQTLGAQARLLDEGRPGGGLQCHVDRALSSDERST